MSGLDELINDLQEAIKQIEEKTPELLEGLSKTATREIKAVTPSKSGKLKKSIQAKIEGNKATIDSNLDYAEHVEYGHYQEERFVPILDRMLSPKFVKGSHMFENGMNNAEPKLDKKVEKFMNTLPIFK